jgi:hypothetical protein
LAILLFILLMWLLLPGGLRMGGLEKARDNKEKVGDDFRKGMAWVRGKSRATTG